MAATTATATAAATTTASPPPTALPSGDDDDKKMQQALQGNIKGEERKEQWPSRRQSGAATSVHPSPSYLQRKKKRNPPLPSPFGGGVVIYRLSGGRRGEEEGTADNDPAFPILPIPFFYISGLLQVGISATHTVSRIWGGGAKDKKKSSFPFFLVRWIGDNEHCLSPPTPAHFFAL